MHGSFGAGIGRTAVFEHIPPPSLTAEEHAKHKEDVAKLREALEASKAELEMVAPGGRLPLLTGGGVVPPANRPSGGKSANV